MMKIKTSVSSEINVLSSYKIIISVVLLLHMIRKITWIADPSMVINRGVQKWN